MAFVHEKLYRSKDLSRVALSDYIGSLLAHLSRIYIVNAERIRFETEVEDIALEISTAIPCGLLINEMVRQAASGSTARPSASSPSAMAANALTPASWSFRRGN